MKQILGISRLFQKNQALTLMMLLAAAVVCVVGLLGFYRQNLSSHYDAINQITNSVPSGYHPDPKVAGTHTETSELPPVANSPSPTSSGSPSSSAGQSAEPTTASKNEKKKDKKAKSNGDSPACNSLGLPVPFCF
jgi:hypothetical protein